MSKLLKKFEVRRLKAKVDFMISVSLFPNISRLHMARYAENLVKRKFSRNQTVFAEGEKSDRVFLIVKGEFELKKSLMKT